MEEEKSNEPPVWIPFPVTVIDWVTALPPEFALSLMLT